MSDDQLTAVEEALTPEQRKAAEDAYVAVSKRDPLASDPVKIAAVFWSQMPFVARPEPPKEIIALLKLPLPEGRDDVREWAAEAEGLGNKVVKTLLAGDAEKPAKAKKG